MSVKRVKKEAPIATTLSFMAENTDEFESINPSFAMNHIDIISLDASGDPVTPTTGEFNIFVRTDVNGGFKRITERSTYPAKLTGGSLLADGVAVDAKFSGLPLEFKIVPSAVDVAVSYRVDIKQSSTQLDRTTPIETSDRGVVAVPVSNQDQTTGILTVPFLQDRGAFTLAAVAVVNQNFIDAVAGHGIVVGEWVEVAAAGTQIFMQSQVLTVVVNNIELDSPVNFPYQTTDLTVRSSNDMIVDGSVTPQVFSILPLPIQIGDIVRMVWSIQSSLSMDFSKFGGDPALTNGVVIRVNNGDGTYRNLFNFKTNGDIIEQCHDFRDLQPAQGNTIKGFSARLTWGGPSKHGAVIRVDGSLGTGESLEAVVQDDLTGGSNIVFGLRGQGSEVQD